MPVTLRLQGKDVQALGTVYEDDEDVRQRLTPILQSVPVLARAYQVASKNGTPKQADVDRVVQEVIVVEYELEE